MKICIPILCVCVCVCLSVCLSVIVLRKIIFYVESSKEPNLYAMFPNKHQSALSNFNSSAMYVAG